MHEDDKRKRKLFSGWEFIYKYTTILVIIKHAYSQLIYNPGNFYRFLVLHCQYDSLDFFDSLI